MRVVSRRIKTGWEWMAHCSCCLMCQDSLDGWLTSTSKIHSRPLVFKTGRSIHALHSDVMNRFLSYVFCYNVLQKHSSRWNIFLNVLFQFFTGYTTQNQNTATVFCSSGCDIVLIWLHILRYQEIYVSESLL